MEAKVEICSGSIKAWMKGGRRGEVEGRREEKGQEVDAQREGGVKKVAGVEGSVELDEGGKQRRN